MCKLWSWKGNALMYELWSESCTLTWCESVWNRWVIYWIWSLNFEKKKQKVLKIGEFQIGKFVGILTVSTLHTASLFVFLTNSKKVTWCFMSSQPLQLYQGDIYNSKPLTYCVLKHMQHTALIQTRKEIHAGSNNSSLTANTKYLQCLLNMLVPIHFSTS